MNITEAKKILKQTIEEAYLDEPEGKLYLKLIDEDADKFYFEVYDLPENVQDNWDKNDETAVKYTFSPPWYVDKHTGYAGINWGIPPEIADAIDKK